MWSFVHLNVLLVMKSEEHQYAVVVSVGIEAHDEQNNTLNELNCL